MHNKLKDYISGISGIDINAISEERTLILMPLKDYIKEKVSRGLSVNLTFICTHNSRRSHFGQVWAQIAAKHFGVKYVQTFSGGTEATACNPRTINALERAGCMILSDEKSVNPLYSISYADESPVLKAFSKVFDDKENPQENFVAIMTCDSANEQCPLISGADLRLPVLYNDPKVSDDTVSEENTYDERCKQIATEMFWVFSDLSE